MLWPTTAMTKLYFIHYKIAFSSMTKLLSFQKLFFHVFSMAKTKWFDKIRNTRGYACSQHSCFCLHACVFSYPNLMRCHRCNPWKGPIVSTPRAQTRSCLPRGLLFKQRLAIGQIWWSRDAHRLRKHGEEKEKRRANVTVPA